MRFASFGFLLGYALVMVGCDPPWVRIVIDADSSARAMLKEGSVRIRVWKDGTNPDTESPTWPADSEPGGMYSGQEVRFPITETFVQGGRDEVTGERLPVGFTVIAEMSESLNFPSGSALDGATHREYVLFPSGGGSTERFTFFGACAERDEPCPDGSQCYEDGSCSEASPDDAGVDASAPDGGEGSTECMPFGTGELVAVEELDYGFTNPPNGFAEALAVCDEGVLDARGAFWSEEANGNQLMVGGSPVTQVYDASCQSGAIAIIAGDRLFSRASAEDPWTTSQSQSGDFIDVLVTANDVFVLTETNVYHRGTCEDSELIRSDSESDLLYLARVEAWDETFVASSDGNIFRLTGTTLVEIDAPRLSEDVPQPHVKGFYGSSDGDGSGMGTLRYLDTYGDLWEATSLPTSESSWIQIASDAQVGIMTNNEVDLLVVGTSSEIRIRNDDGFFDIDDELTEIMDSTNIVPTRGVAYGSQALLLGSRGFVAGRDEEGNLIRNASRTLRGVTDIVVNGADRFIVYGDRAYFAV